MSSVKALGRVANFVSMTATHVMIQYALCSALHKMYDTLNTIFVSQGCISHTDGGLTDRKIDRDS